MTQNPSVPGNPDDDPDAYVGLPAGDAEVRATAAGWSTVRVLPHDAVVTLEYVAGRINLAVSGGAVVRCWKG